MNPSLSNIGSIACTEGYEAAKPDTVVTADQEALWARVWFEVKLFLVSRNSIEITVRTIVEVHGLQPLVHRRGCGLRPELGHHHRHRGLHQRHGRPRRHSGEPHEDT